jgi:hypothetical protein
MIFTTFQLLALLASFTLAADVPSLSVDGKCGIGATVKGATCLASEYGNCCSKMNWWYGYFTITNVL